MEAEDVSNGGYDGVGIAMSACWAKIILYSIFLCFADRAS